MRMFTVSLPLVPFEVGRVVDRTDWPAHITLIGNFRAPGADAVMPVVERFAARTPPVRAAVGEEAWFGPDGTVLVDLVEVPLLRSLHSHLLGELEAAVEGLELLLPHHAREAYRPHRTVTAGQRPVRGDVLGAGRVALAELDPPGRPGIGVVLGTWDLKGTRLQLARMRSPDDTHRLGGARLAPSAGRGGAPAPSRDHRAQTTQDPQERPRPPT